MRMPRVNVYLPDQLYQRAKRARLNVSELSQKAIRDELLRKERMQALDVFLDELSVRGGPATVEEAAAAEAWATDVLGAAERVRTPRRGRGAKRRGA
jgi:hypothetical protein